MNARHEDEEPDQRRADGAQISAGGLVERGAYHAASAYVADADIPGRADDVQKHYEQEDPAPSPPLQGIGRGDIRRTEHAEEKGPNEGAYAEYVVEKTGDIGAETSGLVPNDLACGMIQAGVVRIERQKAQQNQKRPEEQEAAEKLTADNAFFRSVVSVSNAAIRVPDRRGCGCRP